MRNHLALLFIGYVFSQPLARSLATIYIFARVRIFGTLVPFYGTGNFSKFPVP